MGDTQPKRGEMLLSVHDLALGLYEEDNMGAIKLMPLNQQISLSLILDLKTVGRRNAFDCVLKMNPLDNQCNLAY